MIEDGYLSEVSLHLAGAEPSAGEAGLPLTADGHVRIGPVGAVPIVLTELGLEPEMVFSRAGVPPGTFENPENRLAFDTLGRLLSECADLTNCAHFGLLVGEKFDLNGLGAIGGLMRASATVGDALSGLLSHLYLHDRGAAPILLNMDATSVILGYSIFRPGLPGALHVYDAAIAIGHRALMAICGPTWKPLRVQFSHVQPANTRPYSKCFGPSLRFDAEVSGIVFAASWLNHPIDSADPLLRTQLAAAMRQQRVRSRITFASEVRSVLHQMVLSGKSSAVDVADFFAIHERTLRKRLAAEKTSLHALVSQTRYTLAQQLLANTQLPISEIAAALHYADLPVFSRAFRKWAHVGPKAWRDRLYAKEASAR